MSTMCGNLLGVRQFLASAVTRSGELGCLSPKVEELEVDIVGNIGGGLAMALPLEHCRIELQFEKRGDERPRRLVPESLECLQVLLTTSCRRRNSLPVPSLRGGASTMARTCA